MTGKYPHQIVLMVSTDVKGFIDDVAEREGLHKTQVCRSFLHAGIRKAGYGDVLTSDLRTNPVAALGPDTGEIPAAAP